MTGNVRIFPLLVFAGISLFVLKAMGLMLSGGYVLSGVAPAVAQDPKPPVSGSENGPEQQIENAPADTTGPEQKDGDVEPAPEKQAQAQPAPPGPEAKMEPHEAAAATDAPAKRPKPVDLRKVDVKTVGPANGASRSELAVLEGLSNRRKTLDQREREIDLRENLLKAAEKRVEARISELKAIESRIEGQLQESDDNRKAEYQRLVKMYAGMKPQDAARIFDRLELNVLTGLVSQMKPRSMSSILAAMTPAAAERLTLEIANRGKPKPKNTALLPRIESQ